MGRGCRADLQVPGGGEPPPYGCMIGAGCVGPGLPGKFAVARRGHDPALRVHGRGAGALGWGCRSNRSCPAYVMTPPYGCMVRTGCVGTRLPIKSQLPGLCHDPALRVRCGGP